MSIRKYGRYWAVYASDGALICLCVYRKGALEVVKRIQQALDISFAVSVDPVENFAFFDVAVKNP
jgi:hypothetical protein